ncbi:MAG: 2TM domain-containing protein [Confluentibacter sp.]|nr:2TM domain-containing protein [Confluentibacter sp.]
MKVYKEIGKSFFVGTLIFLVVGIIEYLNGWHISSGKELLMRFISNQVYSVCLYMANAYFFYFIINHYKNWFRWQHLGKGILGSVVISVVTIFLLRVVAAVVVGGSSFAEFIQGERPRFYYITLLISVVVTTIFYAFYYYKHLQENKVKEQKIIAGTASAQFDALKNQLDPHFLFNSLNVLTSLIEENPEAATQFTTALSKVYRYVLEQKNKELVTVEEELQFATLYMSLLKMRFEDSIIFDIPEKAINPESKVVPLSLQLLLENAVKHNIVTTTKPLHIKIYEANDALVVENNLQSKQIVKKSSGVGLSNIMQRYDLLTNRKININKEANRFAVAIPMLTKQIYTMETKQPFSEQDAYMKAKKRVEEIKNFYSNLLSYCLVIPFLIFINYKTFWGFQWFWFPMLGWGMGLTFHGFSVFGYGKSWEERKIQEILDKEASSNNKTWN